MLTWLEGGRIVDPAQDLDAVRDLWIRDGRVIPPPHGSEMPDEIHDCAGKIIMAGAIDIHTHVAGADVTLARLFARDRARRAAEGGADAPRGAAAEIGRLYAEMGFTTVVEPAMPARQALQTHLELAEIPILDKAALTLVGNDDFLLRLIADDEGPDAIRDAVAHDLAASRGLGLALIQAGASAAFKQNLRCFDLDDSLPHYGISGRAILSALIDAAEAIGVRHPLHVRVAGAFEPDASARLIATMRAAEGRPLHLSGIAAHAARADAEGGVRSAAADIAVALAEHKTVSADIGQILFGPTVGLSHDGLTPGGADERGRPDRWHYHDGDADGLRLAAGDWRPASAGHQLRWAIGLELMLLSHNPGRLLLSTDHPNGAPFTAYPKLVHLLMDRSERERWIERMPAKARARTGLAALKRQYTLSEIATVTRTAPARLLGLDDRGHLRSGAAADVAVYDDLADRGAMFAAARLVLKDGRVVVRDGRCVDQRQGRTLMLQPATDAAMNRRIDAYLTGRHGVGAAAFAVAPTALAGRASFKVEPCAS